MKWIARGIFGAAVLGALFLSVWMAVQGPGTVMRLLRYRDTTIWDFRRYPFRALSPADRPEPIPHLPDAALDHIANTPFGAIDLRDFMATTETIALIVAKDDRIVFEAYANGHGPGQMSQVFSVSKSVLSMLIGAAIDDGIIGGVAEPVTAYIPELSAAGFGMVSLEDLLTMRARTDYVENDNPFGAHVRFNFTPQLEREILKLSLKTGPYPKFEYKTGDNALLALVLARALGGRTITDYTWEKLWSPLGMQDAGLWSLDHAGGLEKTWCCLSASARDLVKLGMVMRDGGQWRGASVIPAEWVAASIRPGQYAASEWQGSRWALGLANYGYQWWLVDQDRGDFTALGKGGQYIYVDPATEVVIVRLGYGIGRRNGGEIASSAWMALFERLAEAANAAR